MIKYHHHVVILLVARSLLDRELITTSNTALRQERLPTPTWIQSNLQPVVGNPHHCHHASNHPCPRPLRCLLMRRRPTTRLPPRRTNTGTPAATLEHHPPTPSCPPTTTLPMTFNTIPRMNAVGSSSASTSTVLWATRPPFAPSLRMYTTCSRYYCPRHTPSTPRYTHAIARAGT